jgi:hypothetical protein
MREITTYGRVEAGVLKITRRGDFMEGLSAWSDCRVVVTVSKIYSQRSRSQNAYFHGVIVPEVRRGLIDAGYSAAECTAEAVKDLLKTMFARREMVNTRTGEVLTTVQATSHMTTTEMMEFQEECRRFASEFLGVTIPSPNEQTKIIEL